MLVEQSVKLDQEYWFGQPDINPVTEWDKYDKTQPTDWEEWDWFVEEWLEEKQRWEDGEIDSRPLDEMMQMIGGSRFGSENDKTWQWAFAVMDVILAERCKSELF